MRKVAFTGALLFIIGCADSTRQPDFPTLHPVKGVVMLDGRPVKGGSVLFTPEPDCPHFLINAEVGEDGTFSLSTVRTTDKSGERRSGAPAGQYRVTYMPVITDQTARGGVTEPVVLKQTFTIQAGPNEVVVNLPKR